MIFVKVLIFSILTLFLLSCSSTTSTPPGDPLSADAPLSITWELISNVDLPDSFTSELVITNASEDTLAAEGWSLYFNFIRLLESHTNTEQVQITHINGDFYRLDPASTFTPLAPQEQVAVTLQASAWAIKETDAPSGFYMVHHGSEKIIPISDIEVMPFTLERQTSRMASDNLPVPTPESTYEKNLRLTHLPENEVPRVIPTPQEVTHHEGSFTIAEETTIYYQSGLEESASFLSESLAPLLGTSLPTQLEGAGSQDNAIVLRVNQTSSEIDGTAAEAYTLAINPQGIAVTGATTAGVFYGIQTLRALFPPEVYTRAASSVSLASMQIADRPRFPYRGMHLDVSRNFHPAESVKKLLDIMAFYKLNKFHFHITDDEGWRIEIPGLPELTTVGARRGHTEDESEFMYPSLGSGPYVDQLPGSGFYSREEYIDILQYAKARHIEVIPEIDVPGHARAAIVAMKARHKTLSNQGKVEEANAFLLSHPDDTSDYLSVQLWNDNVIDVCMPSTYAFLDKVFDELILMHQEAGAPLTTLHTGGDEVPHGVWTGSPACESVGTDNLHDYFLENVYQLLNKNNIKLAGWEEIALTESPGSPKGPNPAFVPYKFQAHVWNNVWGWGMEDMAYKLANAGYPVVLSNATNLYFDLSYDKSPEEPGYYWASFVDTYKAFALTPLDIFKTATEDNFGNPIDRNNQYPNRVKLTTQGRQNILGLQGQLWSERAYDQDILEYKVFPKLLGLAERAWTRQPEWATLEDDAIREAQLSQAWNLFANQLGQNELPKLDGFNGGIKYRLPPPGARIIQGKLYANTAFPGLQIRYSQDGTLPTIDSPLYTEPVSTETPIQLRTFSSTGRYSRAITVTP